MRIVVGIKFYCVMAMALTGLAACSSTNSEYSQALVPQAEQVTDMPYHPVVYHLDLSILAYQLYGQSLIWPFDPYYEELASDKSQRKKMMEKVRKWAKKQGAVQKVNNRGVSDYRGPGLLNGYADNPTHDPIIYDYSLVHPWSDTITNAAGTWTEYLTPKQITGRIKNGYICYRPTGQPESASTIVEISRTNAKRDPKAADILLAFEGGTGDKGEDGQPHSQSLMGFVLLRQKTTGGYDAHIAFRGSRSGSAARAAIQSFSDGGAKGNPDWITDLGYNKLSSGQGGSLISRTGQVHRGFARSIQSILPQLTNCLKKAATLKKSLPENIFVTGHSLGGALAQQFTSAILLGARYGPDGTGPAMPRSLRDWPWQNIKLLTFGAPRVGDKDFATMLTVAKLQSEQFSTAVNPIDKKALKVTDPSIVARLSDTDTPVGFRVLNSKDPITTEKFIGGKHVGKTIYVNKPRAIDAIAPPDFSAHEQRQIRDYMLKSLNDPAIPALSIRYVSMKDINPQRNKKDRGSETEYQKLVTSIKSYYTERDIWFDSKRFDENVALHESIKAK
ncbi:MAG: lipase family protein [Roseibium sp.]